MKCKNHRIRTSKNIKYGYCTKHKKEVPLFCKCNEIEYTQKKSKQCVKNKNDNTKIHSNSKKCLNPSKTKKNDGFKKKTAKLSYLERNRISLFTNDLNHCIICGAKQDNLHEVFFGRNRQLSMKYGLVIPLCIECHQEMHKNKQWQDDYKRKGQALFVKAYPDLDFLSIFHRNYL